MKCPTSFSFLVVALLLVSAHASSLSQLQLDAIRSLLALIPGTGTVLDPCAFSGVVCANVSSSLRQVVQVALSGRGMKGELPATIGALTSLQSLDLSDNMLVGQLPQSMGSLLSLSSLNLGQPLLQRGLTDPITHVFLCPPPLPPSST